MDWFNEPPVWQTGPGEQLVHLKVAGRTDFWRKTHDGGQRDNGHFFYQVVTGDFTTTVRVAGNYAALYDQAGLMLRVDELTWLKCGVEFLYGVQQASVVVTRDWSDWSVLPLANPTTLDLRVVRYGGTVEVYAAWPDGPEILLRQAFLSEQPALQVGLMAAAPTGPGFPVTFEGFRITQA